MCVAVIVTNPYRSGSQPLPRSLPPVFLASISSHGPSRSSMSLNRRVRTVEGTPDAPYTRVDTRDWLGHLLDLFAIGIPQKLRLLEYL